jgi:hypothetical protein
MGDANNPGAYSVPDEAKQLFRQGILNNPLIKSSLPAGWEKHADKIHFDGTSKPAIPINWRFAESVSALKAYEALLVNAVLEHRYGAKPVDININT